MKRSLLLAALLVSPLTFAAAGAGTGTTFPDDPHNPAPTPGVDSTLNPVEKPMPRDTDPRLPGDDQRLPGEDQRTLTNPADDQSLPGMGTGTGTDAGGATTTPGATQQP